MKRHKKFGFTLSEALVALGVLGIVAVLTIPNVVNDRRKQLNITKLKKVYTDMQENLSALQAENYHKKGLTNSKLTTKAGIREFFDTYYQIKKNCGTTAYPCFAAKYKNLNGNSSSFVCSGQNYLLKNGAAICMSPFVTSSGYVKVQIDVNGSDKPNTFGRDAFIFYIYEDFSIDEVKPEKIKDGTAETERNTLFSKYCRNSTNGRGCFAKILNDNWKMTY